MFVLASSTNVPIIKKKQKNQDFFYSWRSCPLKLLQLCPTLRFCILPNEKLILIALKIQQWEGKYAAFNTENMSDVSDTS